MKHGWPEKPIGDLCRLINGRAFKPSEWRDRGLPIVRIQNLNDLDKGFNYCDQHFDEKYLIDDGELLFSWSGTPGTSFGAFFWNRGKAWVNQHIFRVIPDASLIEKPYFRYALNYRLNQIIDQSHGGVGLKHITKGRLEATTIPLPPLPAQRRIAAVLDKADALRRKRRRALDKLDELLRAVFLDMFGDPVRNPKGWSINTLNDIIAEGSSVTYGIVQAGEHIDDGVPYIKTGDIKDGVIAKLDTLARTSREIAARYKRSEVKRGDLVMSIRASVGEIALVLDELDGANLTQGTAKISPGSKVNRYYLLSYIRSRGGQFWIKQQLKGATFREITLRKLREMPVLIPPLDEQHRYENIFLNVDKLRADKKHHLEQLDILFNALMQKAFKGELTFASESVASMEQEAENVASQLTLFD